LTQRPKVEDKIRYLNQKKKKRTGISTPSSDISAPFGAEISLFGAIILLNSDVSVSNDAEISLEGVKISLAKKKKKKKTKNPNGMYIPYTAF
jgi:hypothetical protein